MNTAELRTQIYDQLARISDIHVLEEVNAMLDFKRKEVIYKCSEEQRRAVFMAQQAIQGGEYYCNEEVNQAVEVCLSEN